jgi:hypothetical protein
VHGDVCARRRRHCVSGDVRGHDGREHLGGCLGPRRVVRGIERILNPLRPERCRLWRLRGMGLRRRARMPRGIDATRRAKPQLAGEVSGPTDVHLGQTWNQVV